MLAAALDYAAHSVPVFPVYGVREDGRCACGIASCDNAGKHPSRLASHGFKNATTDPAVIRDWWTTEPTANIAEATGIASTVLDVDPRHGGDETLRGLEQQHGPLPETAEVLTPGGGRHVRFAPEPDVPSSVGRVGPGLDIRSAGGYALLPPSRHIAGRAYCNEIEHARFEVPLARMPAWLKALALRSAPSANGGDPAGGRDWAVLLSDAPEGKRHSVACQIAGHFLGHDLPPAEVTQILLGFCARCRPAFPEAEARQIVEDLAAKDARARAEHPDAGGAPPASAAADVARADVWADGRALYQRPPRRHTHLVEGVIPAAGLVLGTGEDKAGKSTLGALLVLCYLHGLPFLGRAVTRAGRAVIVSEEDDGDELRDRLLALHRALAQAHPDHVHSPETPEALALVEERLHWEAREGFRVDDELLMRSLLEHIARLRVRDPEGPPVLVPIDSLQAVRGLLNPANPEGVAALKLALRRLVAAGAVVYLIAHARKVTAGGKRTARASQEVAASHELAAEAASTLGLMPINARPDAPVRLDLVTKRGASAVLGYLCIAHEPPETWPPRTITVTIDQTSGAEAKTRTARTDSKVLDALRTLSTEKATNGQTGVSRAAIQKATGLSDKTVRLALICLGALEVGETTRGAKLYRENDAK
jgi:hypothetical protein